MDTNRNNDAELLERAKARPSARDDLIMAGLACLFGIVVGWAGACLVVGGGL